MLASNGLGAITEAEGTAAFIACEEVANDVINAASTLDATESTKSASQPRGKKASFSINDMVVSEPISGTVGAKFTVFRSGDTTTAASVDYQTMDGTAAAPGDYVASGLTTLSFAPGETAKDITIEVNADGIAEPDEVFYVDLPNAVNATIKDGQGQGTIRDTNTTATPMFVSNISAMSEKRGRHTSSLERPTTSK